MVKRKSSDRGGGTGQTGRAGTSAGKARGKLDARLDAQVANQIGQRLKSMYDEVVNEPVPDRFLDLLKQLNIAPTSEPVGDAGRHAPDDADHDSLPDHMMPLVPSSGNIEAAYASVDTDTATEGGMTGEPESDEPSA